MPPRGAIFGRENTDWLPERKILFILCGRHSEFAYWANKIMEKTDAYNIIYAHEARIVRGYRNERYICLGNWYRHSDMVVEEMMMVMRGAEFQELMYSDIFEFESEEAEREHYKKLGSIEFLSEEEMEI